MLVISRRPGEEVVIDGPAKIKVVRVTPDSVRLAFEAPASTGIWRTELIKADDVPASLAGRKTEETFAKGGR